MVPKQLRGGDQCQGDQGECGQARDHDRGGDGQERRLQAAGDQRPTGEGAGVCLRAQGSSQSVFAAPSPCRHVSFEDYFLL